jgi:hypothetical protein
MVSPLHLTSLDSHLQIERFRRRVTLAFAAIELDSAALTSKQERLVLYRLLNSGFSDLERELANLSARRNIFLIQHGPIWLDLKTDSMQPSLVSTCPLLAFTFMLSIYSTIPPLMATRNALSHYIRQPARLFNRASRWTTKRAGFSTIVPFSTTKCSFAHPWLF